jgi:hypothetical protein
LACAGESVKASSNVEDSIEMNSFMAVSIPFWGIVAKGRRLWYACERIV